MKEWSFWLFIADFAALAFWWIRDQDIRAEVRRIRKREEKHGV